VPNMVFLLEHLWFQLHLVCLKIGYCTPKIHGFNLIDKISRCQSIEV
jgi:hypothetical protein